MDQLATSALLGFWKRKKTYLWALCACGFVDALLYAYGLAHPPTQAGIQLFMGFTLNVVLLGWCYVDADEKKVPISGLLGFTMLFISIVGVPWYFLRSRGPIGGLKGGFGLGLFALWFVTFLVGAVAAAIVQLVIGR